MTNRKEYTKPEQSELRGRLTKEQYDVTQHAATEAPFSGAYWNFYGRGIYVDIATGEPLFLSSDKFDSGCGWPSFTKPAEPGRVLEFSDTSHGMVRTEVKSHSGNSHLGHVFGDGPKEAGGLRYCINSAALRFVPYEKMEAEGYAKYMHLV
jgi:peptide methionine sulfoxide reductase msrA/msrB